jgi:hypothetical protein
MYIYGSVSIVQGDVIHDNENGLIQIIMSRGNSSLLPTTRTYPCYAIHQNISFITGR